MDNYKDKINNLKKEIELSINKMSFYEETRELKQLLIDKYHELNNKYQEIDSDYQYKKYYIELELFYEHEITRVMDLIINKKKDKSLYDNSDKEVNEKIQQLINKLNKEIYLMNNFPYFKKIIFLKLSKIINYYQGEEKISEDISKHNIFTDMGIDSNIVLGFGDSKELKKSFLRSLEAIDSYDLEDIRIILANEKRIISLKESLKDDKILSSYAKDILEKYYNNLKNINSNVIGIYELIIKIQGEVLNNLIELNNKYQQLKEKDNMSHYLNNLIYPQIDIEYLLKIEKENKDNELEDLFYEVVYWIITIDKKYNKLNLYEKLSEKTRLKIEQMFIDKLILEQDEDGYQEYLKNGFLKSITKREEDLIERNNTGRTIDLSIYSDEKIYNKYKISAFHEGLARVWKNNKYGYIDKNGIEVIPCIYEDAYSFHEGLAAVYKDGKWRYINREGEEKILCEYDEVYNFSEGLAKVKINGKYGYINRKGEEVIKLSLEYSFASDFHEGLAAVKKDGKWIYINKEGEVKITCKYDHVGDFHEGLAVVYKNGKWRYINDKGKEVLKSSLKYTIALDFHEGLAKVNIFDKWIYMNKEGKEVLKLSSEYTFAYDFHEGLAMVCKNGKYGYINRKGKEVIPCKYDDALDFHEGLAFVCIGDHLNCIDTYGNELRTVKINIKNLIDNSKEKKDIKKLNKSIHN